MHTSARIASSRPLATTAMHGRVESLLGETLVAVFGAPIPRLDHAPDAARAAMICRSRRISAVTDILIDIVDEMDLEDA